MKKFHLPCLLLLLLTASVRAQGGYPPDIQAALDNWRNVYGANWQIVFNQTTGRVRMLFGGGLAGYPVPTTDQQYFDLGRVFVEKAYWLLAVEDQTLVNDRVVILPLGMVGTSDKVSVRYRQVVNGVESRGASVNVLLDLANATLLSIDTTALIGVRLMDVTASVTASAASSYAASTFQTETGTTPETIATPQLVVLGTLINGTTQAGLAWQVDVEGVLADGTRVGNQYCVAAQGQICVLESQNRIYDAFAQTPGQGGSGSQRQGKVQANVTNEGCCFTPDDGVNRVLRPMSRMTATTDLGQVRTTSLTGAFSVLQEAPATRVTLGFVGPYARVQDTPATTSLVLHPTLGPGINLITMNPSPQERDVAQSNAFYRLNQTREWVRGINPFDDRMDSSASAPGVPYRAVVNDVQERFPVGGGDPLPTCNAFYSPFAQVIKFSVGNGTANCPNHAYAPIIWHELGHWLNDRYGNGGNDDRGGFGEGNGDVFALYQMDYHELRRGNLARDGLNTRMFCGDCESQRICGTFPNDPHIQGEPLMGALWKVREALKGSYANGGGIANALFLGWMNAYDQHRIHSIIEWQWLVLDDDDHNLSNLTPHHPEIDLGFFAQGFPRVSLPINVTTLICP